MKAPNLIVLDYIPAACARAYCDTHVMVKPQEYTTLLEAAYSQRNGGPTLSRHVLTKWAQDDIAWAWVYKLVLHLMEEQLYRFDEQDEEIYPRLLTMTDETIYNEIPSRFIQQTTVKCPGDPVKAYREWYHGEAEPCWSRRGAPGWWKSSEQYALRF